MMNEMNQNMFENNQQSSFLVHYSFKFIKPALTAFTNSTGIGVEHAAVTLGMATVVYQTPLLPFVKGHVTQGAAVGHLVLHGQVTQDVNV